MCKRWEGYTKNQPINNNKETVSHGICLDCRRKVKMNWYNQYNNNLEKEAGAKNYLGQMALAISLFFSGEDLLGASNKARVHPQELKINVDKMKGMTNEQKMQYLDKLKGIPTKQKSNVELQKQKPQSLEALTTIEILARTIYAEAEGEPYEGKHAVASVIYNRSNGDVNQMVNVVKSRKQFSCWNSGCPTPGKGKAWEDSLKIAKELINGTFKPTVNYTHYYNPSKANPNWGNVKDYKMIGRHKFLNPSNS
jgi:spore germination cell wall hydrolase CwlJ-like protein